MQEIVLASASARRADLLNKIVTHFDIQPADIDETAQPNESSHDMVLRLAMGKAKAVLADRPDACVIGSDTVINKNNEVLGKPRDKEDFLRMMALLSDSSHEVLTGVAVLTAKQTQSIVVSTQVHFAHLTAEQAIEYWHTNEPADKEGGYAIQGIGGQFIKSIHGSYSSVVGLPLYETKMMLEKVI